MNLPYTPYFINTMLDHYEDRLENIRTDEEASYVRGEIRRYTRWKKQIPTHMNTAQSTRMKTIES